MRCADGIFHIINATLEHKDPSILHPVNLSFSDHPWIRQLNINICRPSERPGFQIPYVDAYLAGRFTHKFAIRVIDIVKCSMFGEVYLIAIF